MFLLIDWLIGWLTDCHRQGLQAVHQQQAASGAVPSQKTGEEEQQAKCDPNKAIPLHYHPLHEQSLSTASTTAAAPTLPPDVDMPACAGHSESDDHRCDVLLCNPGSSAVTWQVQLKALLLRKASIVCYKLARDQLTAEEYGTALNFARQALCCFCRFYRSSCVYWLLIWYILDLLFFIVVVTFGITV